MEDSVNTLGQDNSKPKRKNIRLIFVFILLAMVLSTVYTARNQIAPLSWRWWGSVNATDGVAIAGYDSVAYHKYGVAKKGNERFSYSWKGVDWYFVNGIHLSDFKKNPLGFAPQYGGYCASGVGFGVTAKADPNAWHIEGGKLYLFGSKKVKEKWLRKIDQGFIEQADANWQGSQN